MNYTLAARTSWLTLLMLSVSTVTAQYLQQGNKLKGTGARPDSALGISLAISNDGNTLLAGAFTDDGATGAAWVFVRNNGAWSQQGQKLVGFGAIGKAKQGMSVALSGDGNTAVIGGDDDNLGRGAVWVFVRNNGAWSQLGEKLVPSSVAFAQRGFSVSISSDGNTILIGGPGGSADGNAGAAWSYVRRNGVFVQESVDITGIGNIGYSFLGTATALSGDGNTALIGGPADDRISGATWVFTRSNGVWTQQAKLFGTGMVGLAQQGSALALSKDGNTALIGGLQDNNLRGAAWVFIRNNHVWTQQGQKLVPTDASGNVTFGRDVALSADGNTAILGGYGDSDFEGAIWIFTRSNGVWRQQGPKITARGSEKRGGLGSSVAISADAVTIASGGAYDANFTGAVWAWAQPAATQISVTPLSGATAGIATEIRAQVTAVNPSLWGHPVGRVTFQDNGEDLPGGVVTMEPGRPAVFTGSFSAGVHQITATYDRTGLEHLASSASVTFTVSQQATRTTLTQVPGNPVVLQAAVDRGLSILRPSGKVDFIDTTTNALIGSATLSPADSAAVLEIPSALLASIGARPILASYSGDFNFAGSRSGAVSIPVLRNAAGSGYLTYAADELVSLYGNALATQTTAARMPYPTMLGGVSAEVTDSRGASLPAPLTYVSPTQVNLIIPSGTAAGPAVMKLLADGRTVVTMHLDIGAVAPGIFTSPSGAAAAQAIRIGPNGEQSVEDISSGIDVAGAPVYLVLYGTGIRHRSGLQEVVCNIKGLRLPVAFAGAQPDFTGLDQVNVLLPGELAGAGRVEVTLTVDRLVSNAATVLIRQLGAARVTRVAVL